MLFFLATLGLPGLYAWWRFVGFRPFRRARKMLRELRPGDAAAAAALTRELYRVRPEFLRRWADYMRWVELSLDVADRLIAYDMDDWAEQAMLPIVEFARMDLEARRLSNVTLLALRRGDGVTAEYASGNMDVAVSLGGGQARSSGVLATSIALSALVTATLGRPAQAEYLLSQLAPADSRSRLAAWARAQLLAAYQPSVARQYLEQLAWHQGRSSLEQLRRLGGPVQPYVDDVLSQPQGAYR